jgi:cytochrome bd-type quinol oxidase subunit 2
MAMLDLVVILALLAGACWLAVRAFERPEGVYVKSALRAAIAIVGGLGLVVLLSPLLGSGAGLGVMRIYLAFVALVVALAALACIAASARRAWDAMRSRERGR